MFVSLCDAGRGLVASPRASIPDLSARVAMAVSAGMIAFGRARVPLGMISASLSPVATLPAPIPPPRISRVTLRFFITLTAGPLPCGSGLSRAAWRRPSRKPQDRGG